VAEAVQRLSAFIEHEMADKGLPALSIVLVDGSEIVWAQGFGEEDPATGRPATAETVYRVGSVSKLFTDIGIMQQVARGRLDLDAPVTNYLPEFAPENPFETPITLRQLTSHRAGLVREPPAGHYFDSSGTDLASTVASLNDTRLVFPPGERTKYSNAGIAVVGRVLEQVQGQPFAGYLRRAVLEPLGMTSSAFTPDADIVDRLAAAWMWTEDGRQFPAPTFQLGMAPAGSMYATVVDLGRFMEALFAWGRGERGPVLDSAMLARMLTPQFAPPGATTGYGIGFRLGRLHGERTIGHGGAIYGFATDLAALPDRRLGAASVTTVDGANTVVARIDRYALALLMAVHDGHPLPAPDTTGPIAQAVGARLVGRYGPAGRRVSIVRRGPDWYATFPDRRLRLRQGADGIITDDRLGYGRRVDLVEGGLAVGGDTLLRVADAPPPPAPSRWRDLIGEYGWDFNTLYLFEEDGRLHALIEWFFRNPLTEVQPDMFVFPETGGLYPGERLTFDRDRGGRVRSVTVGGVRFPRREVGTRDGVTFTIEPLEPVDGLRRRALAATPPVEAGPFEPVDLVELRSLDPSIRYDIRYATTNNFMQAAFYPEPHAFLQRPAAEALVRAHQQLESRGLGLLIHDAYRPWYVTKMFWDATPPELRHFVANPAHGSRHNRGAAVDLTLYDRTTGHPIRMVGGYDEFSDRSFPDYPGGTGRQRWYRELLRRTMESVGFAVYEYEWWHFDFGTWSRYPVLNRRFAELTGR